MHPVRLSLSLLFLATTLFSAGQTTTATRPKAQTSTRPKAAQPALPKNIPPVAGPVKVEFALRYQEIKVGTGALAAPHQFYTFTTQVGWHRTERNSILPSIAARRLSLCRAQGA
jgi:hypothetical protein